MTPLWTSEAMAAAMGAERAGVLPACISGISIDSRTLGPGEAFFAITGAASAVVRTATAATSVTLVIDVFMRQLLGVPTQHSTVSSRQGSSMQGRFNEL